MPMPCSMWRAAIAQSELTWSGFASAHLAKDRPADLHRLLEILLFHAPRAVVPGAALDRGDLRAGHHLQELARFPPMFCTRWWHGAW